MLPSLSVINISHDVKSFEPFLPLSVVNILSMMQLVLGDGMVPHIFGIVVTPGIGGQHTRTGLGYCEHGTTV